MLLTPRERVRAAIRGEGVDRVPFTAYGLMLPRGAAERRLRNAGMAVVERVPIFRVEMPNVRVVSHEYYEHNVRTVRETIRTPVGEVYSTKKFDPNYGTSWWTADYYLKKPEDYPVVEFMVRDTVYRPNYEAFLLAETQLGEDGYAIGNTTGIPMHNLIYKQMGIERFSIDLYERPDDLLSLHDSLCQKQEEVLPICAESPAELLIYGGNIHEDVIGLKRFEQYYIPYLNKFSDCAHDKGKLHGCHLDAKMATLVKAVAESRIDVIEAFTPTPTGNVTVGSAREAWPHKVLWVNFPSSVHIEPAERIREETLSILHEAAPGDRLLVGITEDIPEWAWRTSLSIISQTILEHGSFPIRT